MADPELKGILQELKLEYQEIGMDLISIKGRMALQEKLLIAAFMHVMKADGADQPTLNELEGILHRLLGLKKEETKA